ncbi:hypothetical protein Y09_2591 [Brachybacterium sp. SW0106-09]|nr:hypothetical protein Y09_2591 [Brachybacterium sp. SW0106-09]
MLCHRALPSLRGHGRALAARGGGLPIHENGTPARSEALRGGPSQR